MPGGCLRVIGWAFAGVVAVIVLGWIYLTLNPPFGSTDTGYLGRREERRLVLSPAATTATHEVTVGAAPPVYASASDRFEPLRVRATARTDGGVPLAVLVLPADGIAVDGLESDSFSGTATWQIDCQRPSDERPCPRRYLVVVSADGVLSGEVDAVLEVFAEQTFPKYTGTPFAVGIDLTLERRDEPDAEAWQLADTSGTLELSPGAPVASFVVQAPGMSPSVTGGMVLTATATRDGPAVPTGLGAPPPVRLALLDVTGSVIAELGVRPGSAAAVAVPPGSGRHRLVAWWQDRADQAYQVSWQLHVAAIGVPGLSLSAVAEPSAAPIEAVTTAEGVQAFGGPAAPEEAAELPLTVDIGLAGESGHLPQMIGVLRLTLLAVDEDLRAPIVVRLVPARESPQASAPPLVVVLEPGMPREVVLEALPGCPAAACSTWAFLPEDDPVPGETAIEPILVEWRAELRLWPLDPYGTAAR